MSPVVDASDVEAIVIGGSAGVIEALSLLLPAFPADCRAAVIVVVHLLRERPSLLVDLFAHRCALPVREAMDKEPVAPGTVYFAPPDYHLLIDAGPALALSVDDPVNYSRPSIDVLFETAADVYGKRLMGVILTGASDDGAAGAKAVHRAGGIVFIQEPGSAQVAFMPAAALAAAPDSHVISLEQLAAFFQTFRGGARSR